MRGRCLDDICIYIVNVIKSQGRPWRLLIMHIVFGRVTSSKGNATENLNDHLMMNYHISCLIVKGLVNVVKYGTVTVGIRFRRKVRSDRHSRLGSMWTCKLYVWLYDQCENFKGDSGFLWIWLTLKCGIFNGPLIFEFEYTYTPVWMIKLRVRAFCMDH